MRDSDSMLMQLPTPLDCISSAASLAAEPGAGRQRDALFLGGQQTVCILLSVRQRSISREWPASGTLTDLPHIAALDHVEQP